MSSKRIFAEIKKNSSKHLKILFTNNDNNIVINFVNNPLLYNLHVIILLKVQKLVFSIISINKMTITGGVLILLL